MHRSNMVFKLPYAIESAFGNTAVAQEKRAQYMKLICGPCMPPTGDCSYLMVSMGLLYDELHMSFRCGPLWEPDAVCTPASLSSFWGSIRQSITNAAIVMAMFCSNHMDLELEKSILRHALCQFEWVSSTLPSRVQQSRIKYILLMRHELRILLLQKCKETAIVDDILARTDCYAQFRGRWTLKWY